MDLNTDQKKSHCLLSNKEKKSYCTMKYFMLNGTFDRKKRETL